MNLLQQLEAANRVPINSLPRVKVKRKAPRKSLKVWDRAKNFERHLKEQRDDTIERWSGVFKDGPQSTRNLREELGLSKGGLSCMLHKLKNLGLIHKVGEENKAGVWDWVYNNTLQE